MNINNLVSAAITLQLAWLTASPQHAIYAIVAMDVCAVYHLFALSRKPSRPATIVVLLAVALSIQMVLGVLK